MVQDDGQSQAEAGLGRSRTCVVPLRTRFPRLILYLVTAAGPPPNSHLPLISLSATPTIYSHGEN